MHKGTEGYESLSMKQFWECISLESNYTEVKKALAPYLEDARDLIKELDTELVCNKVLENTDLPLEYCKKINNGMLKNG